MKNQFLDPTLNYGVQKMWWTCLDMEHDNLLEVLQDLKQKSLKCISRKSTRRRHDLN